MGIIVPFKTVLSLQIVDYQGFCLEAGVGFIVPFKTFLSLKNIDYKGSCSLNSAKLQIIN